MGCFATTEIVIRCLLYFLAALIVAPYYAISAPDITDRG